MLGAIEVDVEPILGRIAGVVGLTEGSATWDLAGFAGEGATPDSAADSGMGEYLLWLEFSPLPHGFPKVFSSLAWVGVLVLLPVLWVAFSPVAGSFPVGG